MCTALFTGPQQCARVRVVTDEGRGMQGQQAPFGGPGQQQPQWQAPGQVCLCSEILEACSICFRNIKKHLHILHESPSWLLIRMDQFDLNLWCTNLVCHHSQQDSWLLKGPDVLKLKFLHNAKQLIYFRMLWRAKRAVTALPLG